MAHGTPDYGVTAGHTTTYQLSDMAELAVRLGSIVSYDRLGEVFYLDGFEQSVPRYTFTPDGAGAAVAYSAVAARNGLQSLKLTGGSDATRTAQVRVTTADLTPSHVGLQLSLLTPTDFERWFMRITSERDGVATYAEVRLDAGPTALHYLDSAGNPQLIALAPWFAGGAKTWHTFKLVVDLDAGNYARLKVDRRTFPLADIPLQAGASPAGEFIFFEWGVVSAAGVNNAVYVDDLVLTQNEPA